MAQIATWLLLLPLLGFLVIMILGRYMSERQIGVVGTGVVAGSFVLAIVTFVLLLHHSSREVTVNLFSWISVGSLHVPAALLVDPLSITMCLFVTGISALIHLYSTNEEVVPDPDDLEFTLAVADTVAGSTAFKIDAANVELVPLNVCSAVHVVGEDAWTPTESVTNQLPFASVSSSTYP